MATGKKIIIKKAASKKKSVKRAAPKRGVFELTGKANGTKKATVKKASAKKAVPKRAVTSYLTKRILKSAATTGFTVASGQTMAVMGYNVVARNGWVVKLYADGKTEKLQKIDTDNNTAFALD